jgi:hypothetical protein
VVSEVVELHLDEPASATLDLLGIALEVRARVDLLHSIPEADHHAPAALLGTIRGGEFLVVFEEFGSTGAPSP